MKWKKHIIVTKEKTAVYDYSNIKAEKVDDLPPISHDPRVSKPLAPSTIYTTLPFVEALKPGETVKIAIPEDNFGYSDRITSKKGQQSHGHEAMRAALVRTFKIFADAGGPKYICRTVLHNLYIKRLAE